VTSGGNVYTWIQTKINAYFFLIDTNAWMVYRTSVVGIVFIVIHGSIDLFIAIFASYKLGWYFKHKRTIISVAQMSMALIVIGTSRMCTCNLNVEI